MDCWLLVLGLALCCLVRAEWREVDPINEEILHRWICVAVVSNSSHILEDLSKMPPFDIDMSNPREGVFSLSANWPMPDGCKNVTYQFRKGGDGKFHTESAESPMTLESVKVQGEYAMSTFISDNEFRTSILHARDLTIFQKFKEECKRTSFRRDQIVILNLTETC